MPPKVNGRAQFMRRLNEEKKAKQEASASAATAASDDEQDLDWSHEHAGVRTAADSSNQLPESDDGGSDLELLDEELPGGRASRLASAASEPGVAATRIAGADRKRKSRSATAAVT